MSDFIGALPVMGKWSVYNNDAEDKWNPNGKKLVLKIPVESVAAYAQYLMTLADDTSNHKEMEIWNFESKEFRSHKCINVSHNAKEGKTDDDGWYGSIAPKALTPPAAEGCPMPPAPQGCPMPGTLQGSNDNDIPF
tara:strand:- start:291 stop:698 length:408 start_codon:yes stop_codon:yes gene_type:complete